MPPRWNFASLFVIFLSDIHVNPQLFPWFSWETVSELNHGVHLESWQRRQGPVRASISSVPFASSPTNVWTVFGLFFFFFKAREEVVSESPPHARGKRGTESTAGT